MKRYTVEYDGRHFRVLDTANGKRLMCSCIRPDDAQCIAKALNASVPAFNGVRDEDIGRVVTV